MAHIGGGRGDPADPVGARCLCRLDGEPVAGPQTGALGEATVEDKVGVGLGRGTGDDPVRGQRGGRPRVTVGGPVLLDGRGGGQRLRQEGQFGDDPVHAGHAAQAGGEVVREPCPFRDRFRLVLDLGLALLVLDGRPVDVLVGGDHDRRRGIALGADRAAQAGLQEGAAGGDEGGRAHQGDKGAEEAALAGPDGLQGVAQHHVGSLSLLLWGSLSWSSLLSWGSLPRGADSLTGAASGAGRARNRVSTVRAPGGVSVSGRL